jgi:predicted nucleotidyltransferase
VFPPQDPPQITTLPDPHRDFIESSVPRLKNDSRIFGVAVGGSYLLDEIDEFSDLDLVVYIDPQHYQAVLSERPKIVQKIGTLLESFTGEHVGEPRLLICLFGPPLLHIDFKFVSMDDIDDKVENPIVLWERGDVISSQVNLKVSEFPQPDAAWIEKRFWTWIHYTATKIGRGEVFEAVDAIGFLRVNVLGPIILNQNGARPQGLRKLEQHASQEELKILRRTLPVYDARDCLRALHESVELYNTIREAPVNQGIEKLVVEYLSQIESQLN